MIKIIEVWRNIWVYSVLTAGAHTVEAVVGTTSGKTYTVSLELDAR